MRRLRHRLLLGVLVGVLLVIGFALLHRLLSPDADSASTQAAEVHA